MTALQTFFPDSKAAADDPARGFLEGLLATALTVLDAEGGSVVMGSGEDLRVLLSCGLPDSVAARDAPAVPEESISGWVVRTGKPILVRDVGSDPRFRLLARNLRYKNSSLIAVPIRAAGRIYGVVHLNQKRGGGFDDRDLQVLTALADHAGRSIALCEDHETCRRKINELFRVKLKLEKTREASATVHEMLEERLDQISVANKTYRSVSNILEHERLFEALVELLPDVVAHDYLAVVVVDPETGDALHLGVREGASHVGLREFRTRVADGARRYLGRPLAAVQARTQGEADPGAAVPLRGFRLMPLVRRRQVIGLVAVGRTGAGDFDRQERRRLSTVARQSAVTLENAQLYEQTRRMAMTDSLTGLSTRRYFQRALDEEMARSQRYGLSFSLLLIDLDDFKKTNDRFGHAAGDEVLRRTAATLRAATREVDVAGRFGGEEFVVLVPQTELAGACILAEQIRKRIAAIVIETPDGPYSPTASIGVGAFPASGVSREHILGSADKALYVAKRTGKNRVCTA